MITARLLEVVRCPRCRSTLTSSSSVADEAVLDCATCGARYPVRAGIPDLTHPDTTDDPAWETWRQHLDAFQERREDRIEDPQRLANRMTLSGDPQQVAFASFTGIADGAVLDVGCGPGKFSRHLPAAVQYIGLDPIPLPDLDDVDFIRGLAEHIPLGDSSVQHITVLSALDHFRDIGAFVDEARRVLTDDGRLHVVQQVHERGLSVRMLAHWVKDRLEDRQTNDDADAPHHMTEFDREHLRSTLSEGFEIVNEEMFSASRFSPRRQFLTLAPRRAG